MDYIVILLVAFGASVLTFLSGFGLGTMLTPALVIFFPIEMAVAATAIVHLLSNFFKLLLVGKHAVGTIIIRFGLPAIAGALIGAALLAYLSHLDPKPGVQLVTGKATSYLNITIGILIILFSLLELLPALRSIRFGKQWLVPGGAISGFFGGLSGHQGALRSAFLVRVQLSKEQFLASGIAIACMVDMMRIGTYAFSFDFGIIRDSYAMLLFATMAAFGGAVLGKQLLGSITVSLIQTLVSLLVMLIGILLIMGVI